MTSIYMRNEITYLLKFDLKKVIKIAVAVAAVRALDFNDCLYICIGGGGDGGGCGCGGGVDGGAGGGYGFGGGGGVGGGVGDGVGGGGGGRSAGGSDGGGDVVYA